MASVEYMVVTDWPRAVVFDLDGTLVDTAPDILAYLNELLAELGRSGLEPDAVRAMIGDGVRTLLIRGLEASGGVPTGIDLDRLFHRYLERYTKDPVRLSKPFEGVIETLDRLQTTGIKLGVCTNKPQRPTDRLLSKLGLDRYFGAVIGGDTLPVKKPDPTHLLTALEQLDVEPKQSVLIGDSETDLKTARAAAIPCILVSFGYTPIPARQLSADYIIDHFSELIPVLKKIERPSA